MQGGQNVNTDGIGLSARTNPPARASCIAAYRTECRKNVTFWYKEIFLYTLFSSEEHKYVRLIVN